MGLWQALRGVLAALVVALVEYGQVDSDDDSTDRETFACRDCYRTVRLEPDPDTEYRCAECGGEIGRLSLEEHRRREEKRDAEEPDLTLDLTDLGLLGRGRIVRDGVSIEATEGGVEYLARAGNDATTRCARERGLTCDADGCDERPEVRVLDLPDGEDLRCRLCAV